MNRLTVARSSIFAARGIYFIGASILLWIVALLSCYADNISDHDIQKQSGRYSPIKSVRAACWLQFRLNDNYHQPRGMATLGG